MARGKGKPPKVRRNKELIGAGKTSETVKDANGKTNFRKTVSKKAPIKPDRFRKPKQLDLPMKMPTSKARISTKMVRTINGKDNFRKTVDKPTAQTKQFKKPKQLDLLKDVKPIKNNPSRQTSPPKARKVAPPKQKPKVVPAKTPKPSVKNFAKDTAKAISKSVSWGLNKMRNYLSKNISKVPAKSKRVVKRPPTRGR